MEYRGLRSLDDFRRVVDLEKRIWEYADAEDVVPVPILAVNVKRGGILVGAFDADEMVGFVYSLPGVRRQQLVQWSHMLGVVERCRSAGLGFQLKLEQRLRTLRMGVDLIEWTFDPMQALNAHLNFRKLGVIVSEYEENIYGESSSPLHRGTPTDRFVAEWWVRSSRVNERVAAAGRASGGATGHRGEVPDAPSINATTPSGPWLACDRIDRSLTSPRLRVEIPTGFSEMQLREPDLAHAWRGATRDIFTAYLHRGYRIVEFVLDRQTARGWYVLTRVDEGGDQLTGH